MGSLQAITGVLGFFLLISIVIFILSFILNWGKLFTVFWALAAILCAHLLLYCLVVYVGPSNMPRLLSRYILGIADLLKKLDFF